MAVGITQKRLQDESDAAVHNVDLDGFRDGLPSLHLPPRPPVRTDPDRPQRSRNIRAIRWAGLGTGERRPCPGCGRRKYLGVADHDLDRGAVLVTYENLPIAAAMRSRTHTEGQSVEALLLGHQARRLSGRGGVEETVAAEPSVQAILLGDLPTGWRRGSVGEIMAHYLPQRQN